MKSKSIYFFLFLLHCAYPYQLSHPVSVGSTHAVTKYSSTDTLKILTILVQFQQDDDSRTSGDGRFDLNPSDKRIIDAPPHDSEYVADHFIFAKNYFAKVSNGRQHISTTVLGKVITLPKQMKEYAPVDDNTELASMVKEAWEKADSAYPGFPFNEYSLFVICHAGVGKDVDLRGTLGYDPTPYDLPSLYFSFSSLKQFLGNAFTGIPVQMGTFNVTNSIILPETEVRELPSLSGDVTLTLGMNGLLVASIASYLGLPDLFDTKTGKTAIGRFGLMDGQSIFSFLGMCPPEPSAWEKAYLGWTTPIVVYGAQSLSAPAVGLYDTGEDTVYQIPINSKEYFLVENRERDAKNDGQTVTMKWNGQVIQKTFTKDEDYFYNANIDSIYGTVIDVDEPDWGIPGLLNDNNDYPGGIVIWHIDGSVIGNNLSTNSVNADPLHRGVDVEEADGSQDLGQSYDLINPGSGSEDGSPLDFWFNGNIAPVYTNEFSETSHPNSLSNAFGRSHITLKNFSVQSPRMTFDAEVGDPALQLVKIIKRKMVWKDNNDTPLTFDIYGDGKNEFIYTEASDAYLLDENLNPFFNDSTGFVRGTFGFIPTVTRSVSWQQNDVQMAVAYKDSMAMTGLDSAGPGGYSYSLGSPLTTPIYSIVWGINRGIAAAGTKSGLIGLAGTPGGISTVNIQVFADSIEAIALTKDGWVATDGDSIKNDLGASAAFNGKRALEIVNARFEPGGSISTVVRFDDNSIAIYDESTLTVQSSFAVSYTGPSTMAIADINHDGILDILVGTGNSLSAFNRNGSMLEHFPFMIPDGGIVTGCPVVVGVKNSNSVAIVFGSTNGQLYAINDIGKMLSGFPLQTGGIVSSPAISNEYLVAASSDSAVYFWKTIGIFDASRIYWNGYLADAGHSNFVENTGTIAVKSTELLPKSLAYNWPNPVYSGKTNIRYFLGKPAAVSIKILNLAGELVDQLQGTNFVGVDNEVQWDVSKIQSGIYFAQISATGSSGDQIQIVKIAVVK